MNRRTALTVTGMLAVSLLTGGAACAKGKHQGPALPVHTKTWWQANVEGPVVFGPGAKPPWAHGEQIGWVRPRVHGQPRIRVWVQR